MQGAKVTGVDEEGGGKRRRTEKRGKDADSLNSFGAAAVTAGRRPAQWRKAPVGGGLVYVSRRRKWFTA